MQTESMVIPREACRMIPGRAGHGVSRATLWRWMLVGRRGVKLESLLVGGTRYTSREAVVRFVASLNGVPVRRRNHRARNDRDAELVERQLVADGF